MTERIVDARHFTETRDHTWRLMTLEERQKRGTLQDRRTLNRIRQYLGGTLSDEAAAPDRLLEWIDFCYQREHDDQAVQLLSRLPESDVSPEAYKAARTKVRVCESRLSMAEAKAAKKTQARLFESEDE